MKIVYLLVALLVSTNLLSQNSIWIRLENEPKFIDQKWSFENSELDRTISEYQITSIKKALPVAKSTKLSTIWEISCQCDVRDLQSNLNKVMGGDLAQLSPKYQPLYTPNDWNLFSGSNWAVDLINSQQAWQITQGSPNFKIGISDQNIDINHEELCGKVLYWDSTNTQTTTHGNAVSVIAAGKTDNSIGLSSIGFRSSINFYKMDYNGILQAAYDGVDVVNISWTSGCFYNQYEKDIVQEVWSLGTFLVAAAGNGNTCGWSGSPVYPASYSEVFSVSSIGKTDNHEQIPGDTTSTHQHNLTVDLVAPGYEVPICPASGWYIESSGTSYAAPFVTGTIALMLTKNPCLTNSDIEFILKSTATDIYTTNGQYFGLLGAGRLNSGLAVELASQFSTPTLQVTTNWSSVSLGEIQIQPIGLQQPLNITWSNEMTGLQNSGLEPGYYNISIIDAHGCQIDTVVSVESTTPEVNDSLFDPVDHLEDFISENEYAAGIDVVEDDVISVYPNPSLGDITISNDFLNNWILLDGGGRLIMIGENKHHNLSLNTGVYLLKLLETGKTKRVIIL